MLKKEVERGPGGSILIMDSITKVAREDAGAIVVSASHGGASSVAGKTGFGRKEIRRCS